jgi:hypothetical protein
MLEGWDDGRHKSHFTFGEYTRKSVYVSDKGPNPPVPMARQTIAPASALKPEKC